MDLDNLKKLAIKAAYYYVENPKKKPDGGVRMTYIVKYPLNHIQDRIKSTLLDKVVFPDYLQGGLKHTDYVIDASYHTEKEMIIREDIKSFFPSVNRKTVFRIWKHFFHFPEEVAKLLTDLTTFKDQLPQGASTSAHLANLVFGEDEAVLVNELREKGCCYSRYIDDIQVSSDKPISKAEQHYIISSIYRMLFRNGFRPKRKKHGIFSTSNSMKIHNLVVNSSQPTLSDHKKFQLWSAVRHIELLIEGGEEISTIDIKKVERQVFILKRFHPNMAKKLMARLESAMAKMNDAIAISQKKKSKTE